MKKIVFSLCILACTGTINAQDGFSEILAGGLEVAREYSNSYMTPAGEAYTSNLASGWYNGAAVLKPGKVSVDIKVQGTFSPQENFFFIKSYGISKYHTT